MLKHHLKVIIRYFVRNKGHSILNILGLTIGLTVTILIILYLQFELNYDKFHENYKRIFLVEWNLDRSSGDTNLPITPGALKTALLQDIPEIRDITRIRPTGNVLITLDQENEKYYEKKGFYAESSFWEIFTFPMIKGNPKTALSDPFSIVLTEKLATKYFLNEEPIGKILIFEKQFVCKVTGVIKDPPPDSYLKFDFLISVASMNPIIERNVTERWKNLLFHTYALFHHNQSAEKSADEIRNLPDKYLREDDHIYLSLKPFSSLHLDKHRYSEGDTNDKTIIYILSIIAIFTLGISCINFINLSTVTAAKREKEIGIKKVVGTSRFPLMVQFLTESVIIAFISTLGALVLVKLALPYFNQLLDENLNMGMLIRGMLPLEIAGLVLLVGIISGCYLAFYLSALDPVMVLKGISKPGKKRYLFKKALITFQIFVSVLLIVIAVIVHLQINLFKDMDWGFNKKNIMFFQFNNLRPERLEKYEAFKNELLRNKDILNVTFSDYLPLYILRSTEINVEGGGPEDVILCYENRQDYDFIDTYAISIKQGRNFSKEYSLDRDKCIINENLVKTLGWDISTTDDTPIGKKIIAYGKKLTVIGVVNDFKFLGLFPIKPLMLCLHRGVMRRHYISVKISPDNNTKARTLDFINNKFYEFFPEDLFDFRPFDTLLEKFFEILDKLYILSGSLSLLAIFISTLGLFAMASYTTRQRVKEIGLRKVLGANASKIVMLFLNEYFKIFAVANLAAWPCAYLLARQVLQGLTYRVIIHWWVFPLAGLISLAIGLITIASQSIKAAQTNPVDTLKYE